MADKKDIQKARTISQIRQGVSPVIMPAVSVDEARRIWRAYQEMKGAVLDKREDVQIIAGREYLKKSYWRKIATFFNLSVEVVEERREDTINPKDTVFHFVCRAIGTNGRFAIGAGSCSRYEKGYPNTLHNARATAETRAFNRAVSNLVGGGEVSAEEVVEAKEPQDKGVIKKDSGVKASVAQGKKIFALGRELGMEPEDLKARVKRQFKLKSFTQLTSLQANSTIEAMEKLRARKPVAVKN